MQGCHLMRLQSRDQFVLLATPPVARSAFARCAGWPRGERDCVHSDVHKSKVRHIWRANVVRLTVPARTRSSCGVATEAGRERVSQMRVLPAWSRGLAPRVATCGPTDR